MKRFLQPFVFVLLAIYNAICIVTGGASLKKLAPTGVINSGILGGFSGKVGPVVGGKWKDIDYMRSYVIPANPNTTAQQAVREKFAALVAIARGLLSNVLNPFWDPFYSNMSGFNAWISQNYALADSAGGIDETAIMSKGTLTGQSLATALLISDAVGVTWVENEGGNALSTDFITGVVVNTATGLISFASAPVARSAESLSIPTNSDSSPSDYLVFIFAYRGTGSELTVSDSDGMVASS